MKATQYWWRGLHVAFGLLLPLVLVLLFGCKRAKEEKADLGPEVSAEAIDEALAKATYGMSFRGIHVGQYIDYSVIRRLEASESTIALGSVNVGVINAKDNDAGTETKYTLQINKSYRQDNGSFQTVSTEEPLVVAKGTAPSALSAGTSSSWGVASGPRDTTELKAYADKVRATEQPKKITFHRLRTFDDEIPVPDRVKARGDCGGLSPCAIPAKFIRFDMVAWYSDTDKQRISLDFAFSTKTPFLPFGQDFERLTGVLLIDCRSTYVPVTDRNVYVRDCQQVEDFQK